MYLLTANSCAAWADDVAGGSTTAVDERGIAYRHALKGSYCARCCLYRHRQPVLFQAPVVRAAEQWRCTCWQDCQPAT